ncbi:hypothetical protein Tco_1010253 [Tanacetum coccineum]
MTSPNKPTSKPSRVAKMSVKPIWRKKPNLCNTSNVLNTTSPIPKSPTSSTSLLPNGYLNSPTSPPPRVSPPPPTQENASMDITLTLSPITPLDVQFDTPSPSPPIFGHPIPWNLLEAHGYSCLCCIHDRTLIFGFFSTDLQLKKMHQRTVTLNPFTNYTTLCPISYSITFNPYCWSSHP